MPGTVQLVFGLVFVALGAGMFFGGLETGDELSSSDRLGWLIGSAGFALPGLLSVGIGIGRGGLKPPAEDLSTVRRLLFFAGLTIVMFGGIAMAIAIYKVIVTTGGECGTRTSGPCPESSTRWFFQMGGAIPAIVIGTALASLAGRSSEVS